MRRLVILLVCLLPICGCDGCSNDVLGPSLTETGTVVETFHTQNHTASDTAVGFPISGQGGISITPVTITIPETWGVAFRCQHGVKFVTQGTDQLHKDIFYRLDPNMKVTITYREHFREWPNAKPPRKELYKYDFINAVETK